MTCFDINMEEKWTYSWGLGKRGSKDPTQKPWGHFCGQGCI